MDVAMISSRRVTPLSEPLLHLLAEREGAIAAPSARTFLTCVATEWVNDRI